MAQAIALSDNSSLTPFPRSDIIVERKGGKGSFMSPSHANKSQSGLSTSSYGDESPPPSPVYPSPPTVPPSSNGVISRHSPPVRDISTPMPVHDFMRNYAIQVPSTVGYLPQSGANITDMEKRIAFLEGKLASLLADMNENLRTQSDKAVEISLLKEDLTKARQDRLESSTSEEFLTPQQMAEEHKVLLAEVTRYKLQVQQACDAKFSLEERVRACQSQEENLKRDLDDLARRLEERQVEYAQLQASVEATNRQLHMKEEAHDALQHQHEQLASETLALQRQTQWYQVQLQEAVQAREALSAKYDQVSQQLLQAGVDKEHVGTENNALKMALWDMKEKVVEGKKKLIEQLQEIEEGMQMKDQQVLALESERTRLTHLLNEHRQQLEESKRQVEIATREAQSVQTQIRDQQMVLQAQAVELSQLQTEKMELLANIDRLQQEISNRELHWTEKCAEYNRQADELRKSSMQCAELTARLEALDLEKSSLEASFSEHLTSKSELDQQMGTLQSQLYISQQTMDELTQRVNDKTAQLDLLSGQHYTLMTDLEESRTQITLREQALTLLRQQFNELTLVKSKLAEENALLAGEITSLRGRLEGAEMKVSSVLNANLLLEEAGREKDMALASANEELLSVKQDMSTLRAELQQYSEQCNKYQQRIAELEQLQSEVETLQGELQVVRGERMTLEEKLLLEQKAHQELGVAMERRVEDYEAQLSGLRNNEHLLQSRLESMETSHFHAAQQEAQQHAQVVQQLQSELQSVHQESSQLQKVSVQLQERLHETQSQLQQQSVLSERRVQELQQRCSSLELSAQQCRQLEVALHQTYGQISGLQDYVNMLKGTTHTMSESLAAREAELHKLKLDSERRVQSLRREVANLTAQASTAQSTLESEREIRTALQATVQRLQQQQSKMAQQVREKSQQLNTMMHTMHEKERQLNAWTAQKDTLEARMEEMKRLLTLEKQQRGAVLLEKRQIEIEKKHVEERLMHVTSQWEAAKHSVDVESATVASLQERLDAHKKLHDSTVDKLTKALEEKGNSELSLAEEVARLRQAQNQLRNELQQMKTSLQHLVDTHQHNPADAMNSHLLQSVKLMANKATPYNSNSASSASSVLQKCIAGLRQEVEDLQAQSQLALSSLERTTPSK